MSNCSIITGKIIDSTQHIWNICIKIWIHLEILLLKICERLIKLLHRWRYCRGRNIQHRISKVLKRLLIEIWSKIGQLIIKRLLFLKHEWINLRIFHLIIHYILLLERRHLILIESHKRIKIRCMEWSRHLINLNVIILDLIYYSLKCLLLCSLLLKSLL